MGKIFTKVVFIAALFVLAGCSLSKDFDYGLVQIKGVDSKYGTNISNYPEDIVKIDSLANDLKMMKEIRLDRDMDQFSQIIDYRLLVLEAGRYFINHSLNYGNSGTTEDGFGCKQRPLVVESSALRNNSAQKGFEAVSLLRNFVEKFPEEAAQAGVSYKESLFMNATFYEMARKARSDSIIINRFCPQNVTLELYREEFRKSGSFGEEYINNLTYDEAVIIWKESRGIN